VLLLTRIRTNSTQSIQKDRQPISILKLFLKRA
jgi:hypothetical protein